MIRYKEKEFEEYSICPATGDIFNAKTGEVQKTYMIQGRPVFKKMHVHCIMAHTFLGYKLSYIVHHLDENKLNNSLSNLVYLTRDEHMSLHKKGKPSWIKGKKLSEETRAKMSSAHKGKQAWNKGKQLSEDARVKMSLAHKGKPSALRGRQLSEETRAKISSAIKNRRKN